MPTQMPSLASLWTPEEIYSLVEKIFMPSMHSSEDLSKIIKALVDCVYANNATTNPPKEIIRNFTIVGTDVYITERITRWRDAYLIMRLAKEKGIAKDVWLKLIR